MRTSELWHEATVRQLEVLLLADPDVLAFGVVGSGARAALDVWSDLDLLLIVNEPARTRFFPSPAWLAPLGEIFAIEQHPGEHRVLTRLCLADLRRLDIIVATTRALTAESERMALPLHDGCRIIFARTRQIADSLRASVPPPAPDRRLDPDPALVSDFWFKSVLAIQKVVRGDLLVALHLSLDLVQDCLVLAMRLRDRETGTSVHRDDAGRAVLQELESTRQPHTRLGILDSIEASCERFDRLMAEWTPASTPRRRPVLDLIAAARQAIALD